VKAPGQFSESFVVMAHRSQQTYGCDHSITRQTQARENNMTGLLAPHDSLTADQFLENVFIADSSARKLDAARTQCYLQTDIAHYGCNYHVASQFAPRFQVVSHYPHGRVAVNKVTARVHKKRAISITIERNAQVRSLLDHASLQTFYVQRATITIDVAAVRLVVNRNDASAKPAEQIWREFVSRAVGTINYHFEISQGKIVGDIVLKIAEITHPQLSGVLFIWGLFRNLAAQRLA
jgi:hypothetical protein